MLAWNTVYVQNLPVYMQLIERHITCADIEKLNTSVEQLLDKLSFKLPKGLTKKEIKKSGLFPVVSQGKEFIVGYSNAEDKVVSKDLPLIVYGDHSKTIKYIDFPFIIGADGVKLISPKSKILPKYFYYSLIGIETGTKNYGRHFSLLKKKRFTYPSSLDVQNNVIAFIEDLKANTIPKDNTYFSSTTEELILFLQNNSIVTSQLKAELTHQQTLLKKLRQQILQEAIEGKLTEEWRENNPNVEPASELLKRIQAEKAQLIKDKKIKKQKPLPPISEDEKPFDLPDGWVWCRYGNVMLDIEAGKSPTCFNYPAQRNEWGVLKISAISWDSFREDENKKLKPNIEPFSDKEVKSGDFIMTRANTKELVAKSVIVNGVRSKLLLNDKTLRVKFSYNVSLHYMNMFNNGEYSRSHYVSVATGASPSMKNISRDNIKILGLPLPPLPEQKAIVTKVEKLLALCDQLETQITHNQTHANALMGHQWGQTQLIESDPIDTSLY